MEERAENLNTTTESSSQQQTATDSSTEQQTTTEVARPVVKDNVQKNKKGHRFKKPCWICRQGKLLIDYKEVEFLRNYLKRYNKILIHKISGNCLKHQHQLTQAIKRARYIGLLPFVID